MCMLLPFVMIQFDHGFPSIYSNRKTIKGSRCVLKAADVICGHSRGDSNYHDNANYADDNQLNRLRSWAALGVIAHSALDALSRTLGTNMLVCGSRNRQTPPTEATQPLILRCAADRHNYRLQEVCLWCWVSQQLLAMSHLL